MDRYLAEGTAPEGGILGADTFHPRVARYAATVIQQGNKHGFPR